MHCVEVPTPYPGPMPAARVRCRRARIPGRRGRHRRGRRGSRGQRRAAPRRHRVPAPGRRRATSSSSCGGAASNSSCSCDKAEGAPLGLELDERGVRPGAARATTTARSASSTSCRRACASSLYLKDDDYRLSFLYGNFTTLTRFTEADLERVVTERLGPLYVSIHATDPDVRTRLLRNRRGATSLRWLELLLDAGIEVHGQVVVCPGINDGAVLDDTLLGVLDRFPQLATLGVVPLGVSAHNREAEMRAHTVGGGARRRRHRRARGRRAFVRRARPPARVRVRRVLPARRLRPFPRARRVRRLPPARERHRHGAHVRSGGARRARGRRRSPRPVRARGSSRAVDGAPADGYRAPRTAEPA